MLRVRFKTRSDPRPIHWPIKHPYWCSGYADSGNCNYDIPIIVTYTDNYGYIEYIRKNWPESFEIHVINENLDEYKYTDRFPEPEYMKKRKVK